MRDDVPNAEDSALTAAALAKVHARAIKRFDADVLPQLPMRQLALEARRFKSIPGAQWAGAWGDQFENSIKVEINKTARGCRKIETDYRANRMTVDFRTASTDADTETADMLDGLHRADSYESKSAQAYDNAFNEGIAGGFGAWRLATIWADPYDKDSDEQRVNPGMIIVDADQCVFFDGNSKTYDKSDARYAFIVTAQTCDAFDEEWDGKFATSWPDAIPRLSQYDWYVPDVVRVCEYYEVESKDEKVFIFTHPLTGETERWWDSEMDDDTASDMKAKGWKSRTRNAKRKRIHKYVMSGQEVLRDDGYLAGTEIPIVPFYGKREYIDNQERFTGHVQDKMDSQRLYNASVSKIAETNALAPREVPIFTPEQIPPGSAMADLWANQTMLRLPFLYANPHLNPDGSVAALGPIGTVNPPQLQPVNAALIQIANTDLTEDDADGAETIKANVSADAMDIAATRVDAKSGLYLDNFRQSMQRSGEIYLPMACEVYFEAGRKVDTMSEDGEQGESTLAEPHTDAEGNYTIRNDLSRGRYKTIADVTEATSTRRDKTVRSMLHTATVAQAAGDTELAQVAILTAVMNQDGEGTTDTQRYARKRLVSMGVVQPNEEEQQQMKQAQENQQPDPTSIALAAQAKVFEADAQLKGTQSLKTLAEVDLTKAKTVGELADAHATNEGLRATPTGNGSPEPRVIAKPATPAAAKTVPHVIIHTLGNQPGLTDPDLQALEQHQ